MLSLAKLISVAVVLLAVSVNVFPVEIAIPASWLRRKTISEAEVLTPTTYLTELLPSINATVGAAGFPLILTPSNKHNVMTSEQFKAFVTNNTELLTDKMHQYGAILFRGFHTALDTPQGFEEVASLLLKKRLASEYMGTSPRTPLKDCRYAQTASAVPGHMTLPNHMEMSFLRNPPTRIFFYAAVPNTGQGGETPIVDYRKVLQELDPLVAERWREKRVRYIRQYYDQRTSSPSWLVHSKSWQEMFSTNSTAVVEEKCRQQGFAVTWLGDGGVRLVHTMNATRHHPVTGDEVWFNHFNVLHKSAAMAEAAFTAQHLQKWAYVGAYYLHWSYEKLMTWLRGDEGLAIHSTHAHGEPMSEADNNHIRQTIWNNTMVYRHQKHDMVMLDNRRMGHGRIPFSGQRQLVTVWDQ